MSEQLTKFDELELDLGCYQLRRNGNVLKLEKAPMELLILLVAKKGQLVSREEIIEKLWGIFMGPASIDTLLYRQSGWLCAGPLLRKFLA